MYTVVLSEHAKDRLFQYLGTAQGVRAEITTRLVSTLRIGVAPGEGLSVEVRIREGFRAICYPTWEGTWVVATVIPPEGWDGVSYEAADQKGVSVQ